MNTSIATLDAVPIALLHHLPVAKQQKDTVPDELKEQEGRALKARWDAKPPMTQALLHLANSKAILSPTFRERAVRYPSIDQAFWSRVAKADGCWVWAGGRGSSGYGRFKFQRKWYGAHRVSYELNCGPIPPGLFVCHHCDNPPCVRPDHLFVGTAADNNLDRVKKHGRPFGYGYNVGEENGQSVLTAELVQRARDLRARGLFFQEIATLIGVHRSTIASACHRQSWRHV